MKKITTLLLVSILGSVSLYAFESKKTSNDWIDNNFYKDKGKTLRRSLSKEDRKLLLQDMVPIDKERVWKTRSYLLKLG